MGYYSEKDLTDAERFRGFIHKEALEKVRKINPAIDSVVDKYPAEAYLQQKWDYPGAWYTITAIPEKFDSRDDLVNTIVRDTLYSYSGKR